MPKKKTTKKEAAKGQKARKAPAKQKRAKKATEKQLAARKATTKRRGTLKTRKVRRFPSASKLQDLRQEHIAGLATVTVLSQVIDDPPGACMTVDASGRMSCRVTRQSMCTGPNSK